MKQSMTLIEMAQEITRQHETKKDLIADTRKVFMVPEEEPVLEIENGQREIYRVGDTAHNQIAARLGVPVKYYRRMRDEAPQLLAENVNHWFREKPEKRMLRTLDGGVRAFLSDRYRVLDNIEVLNSVAPMLMELNVKVESSAVTETRMYIKAFFPDVQAEIKGSPKVGDIVQAGFTLSNSEIGLGSLQVSPTLLRLTCLNGATFNDMGLKKYHVGRSNSGEAAVHRFLKDDTLKAEDEAFLLKIRDVVTAAADEALLGTLVDRMSESAGRTIEKGKSAATVEVVQKKFSLLDSEAAIALEHLQSGGDLSQFGLANAVTRMAQDVESYDRASELERLGGRLFELNDGEWTQISRAA